MGIYQMFWMLPNDWRYVARVSLILLSEFLTGFCIEEKFSSSSIMPYILVRRSLEGMGISRMFWMLSNDWRYVARVSLILLSEL